MQRRGRIRNRLTLPTSSVDLAYMAGIIDGEGCVTVNNGSWRVTMDNTDEGLVLWFGSFGGTRPKSTQPKNPKHKIVHYWQVTSNREVYRLLMALLPYLKVKRFKAEVALADLNQRLDLANYPLEIVS